MNREALEKTVKTGIMTYWSRSRKKLWIKGETSGNVQKVKEMRFDCDGDALLCKIEQTGGACHEGWESCFAYRVDGESISADEVKMFDPDQVYKK
jgi:phosphoribosyl-AMP cyclohydrolase